MTAVFHPHPAPEISGGRGSTPGIPQWLTEKIDNPAKLTKDEVDAKIKEANIASRIKAEQLRFRKTTTEDITARYDLQFVYIRHREPGWTGMKFDGESSELEFIPGQIIPKGGMVIAYKLPPSGHQVVEISTAICNDSDVFDRALGKYMAAKNFDDGCTIKVKLTKGERYTQQLRDMFEFLE
jgi:hypothetical protein